MEAIVCFMNIILNLYGHCLQNFAKSARDEENCTLAQNSLDLGIVYAALFATPFLLPPLLVLLKLRFSLFLYHSGS